MKGSERRKKNSMEIFIFILFLLNKRGKIKNFQKKEKKRFMYFYHKSFSIYKKFVVGTFFIFQKINNLWIMEDKNEKK